VNSALARRVGEIQLVSGDVIDLGGSGGARLRFEA
jgi:hypothetical protein